VSVLCDRPNGPVLQVADEASSTVFTTPVATPADELAEC